MNNRDKSPKTSYSEYVKAFLEYLRRPKTVYDFQDRLKCIILLIVIIISLQKVVRLLGY